LHDGWNSRNLLQSRSLCNVRQLPFSSEMPESRLPKAQSARSPDAPDAAPPAGVGSEHVQRFGRCCCGACQNSQNGEVAAEDSIDVGRATLRGTRRLIGRHFQEGNRVRGIELLLRGCFRVVNRVTICGYDESWPSPPGSPDAVVRALKRPCFRPHGITL
jgi:hypothetical protein